HRLDLALIQREARRFGPDAIEEFGIGGVAGLDGIDRDSEVLTGRQPGDLEPPILIGTAGSQVARSGMPALAILREHNDRIIPDRLAFPVRDETGHVGLAIRDLDFDAADLLVRPYLEPFVGDVDAIDPHRLEAP